MCSGLAPRWALGSVLLTTAALLAALSTSTLAQGAAPRTVMLFEQPVYQQSGTSLFTNGGFESDLSGWSSSNAVIETGGARAGSKSARIGPGEGSIWRTVTVPSTATADSATLTFWYKANPKSIAPVSCVIRSTATQTDLINAFSTTVAASAWTRVTVDISTFMGTQIDIVFKARTVSFGGGTQESTLWIDDVSLKTDENVWVNPMTDLYLTAKDLQNNLDYTQYREGTGGLFTDYTQSFQLLGGPVINRTLQYRSVDASFAAETLVSRPLKMNPTAPTSVLRYNSPKRLTGGIVIDSAGFDLDWHGYSKSGAGDVFYSNGLQQSGTHCLLLRNGSVSMSKSVTIPAIASRAVLSIWYNYQQGESGQAYIWVRTPVSGATAMNKVLTASTDGWQEMLLDVSSFEPQAVDLTFGVENPSADTSLFIDNIRYLRDASVHVSPQTPIDLLTGSLVPLWMIEYKLGDAVWNSILSGSFYLQGSGPTALAFASTDVMGWREHGSAGAVTQVVIDSEGPNASLTINSGQPFTASTAVTLSIAASDPNNVAAMRFRNGLDGWSAWEGFAQSKDWNLAGGAPGMRTVSAQFKDLLDNVSEVSDTIEVINPQPVNSIGQAKSGMLPRSVILQDRRVTGVFAARQYLYIQDPDRQSGIRVDTSAVGVAGAAPGSTIDISGAIYVDADNEPVLFATSLAPEGPVVELRALVMSGRRLGGGAFGPSIVGVTGASGLHSVGQLARLVGRVGERDFAKTRFRINDGSYDLPSGIWVDLNGAAMPAPSALVGATGNLGCLLEGQDTVPILRLRSPSDLTAL